MARADLAEGDRTIETWEITTGGTVWVFLYDKRDDRYQKKRIGGKSGSRLLHISRGDRKFNQERVIDPGVGDPFTDGTLRLTDTNKADADLDTRYHLSNDQLAELFELRDIEVFKAEIEDIGSELILRRMAAVGHDRATAAQGQALRELIEDRYKTGGTQRTVQEMLDQANTLRRA